MSQKNSERYLIQNQSCKRTKLVETYVRTDEQTQPLLELTPQGGQLKNRDTEEDTQYLQTIQPMHHEERAEDVQLSVQKQHQVKVVLHTNQMKTKSLYHIFRFRKVTIEFETGDWGGKVNIINVEKNTGYLQKNNVSTPNIQHRITGKKILAE